MSETGLSLETATIRIGLFGLLGGLSLDEAEVTRTVTAERFWRSDAMRACEAGITWGPSSAGIAVVVGWMVDWEVVRLWAERRAGAGSEEDRKKEVWRERVKNYS